jgi:hypothetical protein
MSYRGASISSTLQPRRSALPGENRCCGRRGKGRGVPFRDAARKIGGRSREEIADALARLSGEALRIANELDVEPYDAALADVRRAIRRTLAGKTA